MFYDFWDAQPAVVVIVIAFLAYLVGYCVGFLSRSCDVLASGSLSNDILMVLQSWWTLNVSHRRIAGALDSLGRISGVEFNFISADPVLVAAASASCIAYLVRRPAQAAMLAI